MIVYYMNLNVYVAESGFCSRRKATELIKAGGVTINHGVMTDPAYQVRDKDTVRVGKRVLKPESKVYLIFNKPSGCVTTMEDPEGRPTVMDYINVKARVYPVGRLDYDTTGLLLLTNDGDLAEKLSHPRLEVPKTYLAVLDRPLDPKYIPTLQKGIRLRDGLVKVDGITYSGASKKGILVTIHSGKYRVVRRIFEHIGFMVEKLHRVAYAGLSVSKVPKGTWRVLAKQDVEHLKELVASLKPKPMTKPKNRIAPSNAPKTRRPNKA